MKRPRQNKRPGQRRSITIPWTSRWLSRFNRRFDVDKGAYNGTFKSRLGPGHCTGQPSTGMTYTFFDLINP